MFIQIILFYTNYLYLVPELLLKKRTNLYLLYTAIIIIAPVALTKLLFIHNEDIHPILREKEGLINRFKYLIPIFFNTTFIVIGTTIRMYEEWNNNEKNKKDIESEKNLSIIEGLKSQINPHFLFNSLNSIYALTTKKSNDAPEAVITLSELMRYMLYQTNNEFVLLTKELNYIKNYIALQRLRLANNEDVTINIHGSISNQKIKPLLLISFIENAFKYGTDYKGNTKVRICINVNENLLIFDCDNLIGDTQKNHSNSGIGMKNTRERLELLYPENYTLKIEEKDNLFKVNLILKLN